MIKFSSSDERRYFWLQEPGYDDVQETALIKKVREITVANGYGIDEKHR